MPEEENQHRDVEERRCLRHAGVGVAEREQRDVDEAGGSVRLDAEAGPGKGALDGRQLLDDELAADDLLDGEGGGIDDGG